jgi:hypothetical protein
MSTKRTAALAVGVAILIGGGATALATTSDAPGRTSLEAVASAPEVRSIDSAVAEAETVIDTETAESVESATATAPADTVAPEPAPEPDPATTTPVRSEASEVSADAGNSSRLAGPGGSFATMPIKPPDWNGFDDEAIDNPDYPGSTDYPYYPDYPGSTDHGPYDGPGLPFELNGINLEKLTSLARSVGIDVGVPVFGDDGSITVEVTLPDGTAHSVWVATDADQHITDATVDGVPIMEFVRQFLAGEVGRPAPPVEPHPEWDLPD